MITYLILASIFTIPLLFLIIVVSLDVQQFIKDTNFDKQHLKEVERHEKDS